MAHECIQVGAIASLETDVDNLKDWQKRQNGSILRVEEKVDKLVFWQMTTAVGLVVSLLMLFIKK